MSLEQIRTRAGRGPARWVLGAALAGAFGSALAQADFSGSWLPAAELATPWQATAAALTPQAQAQLRAYDRRRHDSVLFCMPLGTPRNMLATAPYPVEILQRPEQLTVIFDGRGDVRRIHLDGRAHPADPVPNWLGHSIGSWQGERLVIDTVAMTAESRLSDDGLPHSEALRVRETWRLRVRDGEQLLQVDLTLEDPASFTAPQSLTRYFRRAPHAEFSETAAYCLLDQWRGYLERHNKELATHLKNGTRPERGARR